MTELKKALQDKIKLYNTLKEDPDYQSSLEQNVCITILRELEELNSIVEYKEIPKNEIQTESKDGNTLKGKDALDIIHKLK